MRLGTLQGGGGLLDRQLVVGVIRRRWHYETRDEGAERCYGSVYELLWRRLKSIQPTYPPSRGASHPIGRFRLTRANSSVALPQIGFAGLVERMESAFDGKAHTLVRE